MKKARSPVEREAKRLLAELFVFSRSIGSGWLCARTYTNARNPAAWKCATIKAHPSRVFLPALRRSLICRRWHAFRFRQIPHSRLVYRRAKRAGWISPSQILQGPLRDAPACTLVHFSSRLEYTSDRYRLRKEERRVLPAVLLMDTFRPSRCHDWPPLEKILCTSNLIDEIFDVGKYIRIITAVRISEGRGVEHSRVKFKRLHLYKPFKFCMKIVAGWVRQQYRFKNHLECTRCPC